jgi:hypothetical protein
MKIGEAAELVGVMAAMTSTRLLEQEREVWIEQVSPLDADLATKAVLEGRREWKRFPSWAQFHEAYALQKKLSEPVGEQRDMIEVQGKRGIATPEWVYVWWWARRSRTPRSLIPFPQEKGFADDADIMSQERYDKLLAEWVAAGSPKKDVAEAMIGKTSKGSTVDDTIAVLKETAE